MKKRTLTLEAEARAALEQMLEHHETPYIRERAAALLKIADGMAGHEVAKHGLLKVRQAETIYKWLNAYQKEGLEGLYQRPRRKRVFPPRRRRKAG